MRIDRVWFEEENRFIARKLWDKLFSRLISNLRDLKLSFFSSKSLVRAHRELISSIKIEGIGKIFGSFPPNGSRRPFKIYAGKFRSPADQSIVPSRWWIIMAYEETYMEFCIARIRGRRIRTSYLLRYISFLPRFSLHIRPSVIVSVSRQ